MAWTNRLRITTFLALLGSFGAVNAAAKSESASLMWTSIRWQDHQAHARDSAGKSVELGLDKHLQDELEKILARAQAISGAATLVDARTGQVLAAAELGDQKSGSLLFDPIAPAASVFKLVTTAALYEKTQITPMTEVCTHGGNHGIEQEHLTPASGSDVVCSKFAYALGVSRNAAYAQLATQKLLRADLIEVAENMGFGARLNLDIRGELGSLEVPYNDLEFARTAAGFENSRLSVFGGAQLALTIASGGLHRPMHFKRAEPLGEERRILSEQTARRIRNAMEVTIHSGTARSSFVNEHGKSTVGAIQVAGKTGTLKPHAGAPTSSWFVGFAPSENPRVVVSVVLQNPDKWHRRGHEVGRDLLRAYLSVIGVRQPKR